MLTTLDPQLFDELTRQAQASPRRRMNYNLHRTYDDPCQRLLNAVEPDSYIRPHRHTTPPKSETFLVVRGRFALLRFTADGALEEVLCLASGGPMPGAEVPPGEWHMIVALEPGSIFFETKQGPYVPLSDKDFAPWAPPEGTPAAANWLVDVHAELRRRSIHAG